MLFSHGLDSSLPNTETVPPLFASRPHITPRDYTGEKLISHLHYTLRAARNNARAFQSLSVNTFGSADGITYIVVLVHFLTHADCILSVCLCKLHVLLLYCCDLLPFSKVVETTNHLA